MKRAPLDFNDLFIAAEPTKERKQVSVYLPMEIYKRLKFRSVDVERTMNDLIIAAIQKDLDR